MALVKFYRGLKSAYNATTHADGIYFATDKGEILLNDVSYGLGADKLAELESQIKAGVTTVTFVDPDTIKFVNGNGNETVVTLPTATQEKQGLMSAADKTKLDGIAAGSQVNVIESVKVDGVALTVTDKAVDIDLATPLANVKTAYEAADKALKEELLGAVEDADAKTIAALNDKIEAVEDNAKTYTVVKLTTSEINDLSDGTNVKEAYKLVDEDSVQSGEVIKVYKDSALQSVTLVDADGDGNEGQFLKFVYMTASGEESTIYLNVSTFLAESEFGAGLVVDNATGIVSVKKDEASEKYLEVSEAGVKVTGVDQAISDAVGAEKTAREAADATHTANIATNAQGVADNKAAIEAEVTRATGVEGGLRTDLGTTADTADKNGSAFARIAQLVADIASLTGGAGSISEQINTAITTLKGEGFGAGTLAALEDALEAEVQRATRAEETNAQAVTTAKNTIDAYTVNGKAISTNPVVDGSDVALTGYTAVSGGTVAATDTVNGAINKLENLLVWHEV